MFEKKVLTQEVLQQLMNYNPHTGIFTWRKPLNNHHKKGDVVGNLNSIGYLRVYVYGKNRLLHRLAFLYMEGQEPEDFTDHIDGNRSNNRFKNLRKCSNSQNQHNSKVSGKNTSGIKGLSYIATTGAWKASLSMKGVKLQKSIVAPFECEVTKTTLSMWLKENREQLHKEFTNHG